MSKIITIPNCSNPFVVIVNGVEYSYPAGQTVEVPDFIAAVIENHVNSHPQPAPPVPGGTGGPQVQSDWNQTDDTQPDFIKNKPFGDEEIVIFPEAQVEFTEDDGAFGAGFPFYGNLTVGTIISVTWGEDLYELEIKDSGFGVLVFGNLSMLGYEDTGEPFLGMVQPELVALIDLQATEPVVRKIGLSAIAFRKLKSKYFDAAIKFYMGQMDAEGYICHDVFETQKVTKAELRDVAFSHQIIMSLGDSRTFYPICIDPYVDTVDYGFIAVRIGNDDVYYYTAEYTG